MTKVVFLTHSAMPAGAELSLVASLDARPEGADLMVVFGEDGEMVQRCAEVGVPTQVLAMSSTLAAARRTAGGPLARARQVLAIIRYAGHLRRLLRRERAEVVVARSLKAFVYGRLATLGTGITFVWSVHDRLTREYLGRTAPIWSRISPRVIDGLVVNSRSTLSTVSTRRVPALLLPPATAVDPRVRQPAKSPVLRCIHLARLAPWKGQDVAIQAFADALGEKQAKLQVVGGALFGEDQYAASLHELSRRLGIADRVQFSGHVTDPVAELVRSDVFIHSTRIAEPFGLVVLEAMRVGCVVIATQPGGPAELIDDGVNGILVPVDDSAALGRALLRVSEMTEDERLHMGQRARVRAADFDPRVLIHTHLTWLADLRHGVPLPALTVGGAL